MRACLLISRQAQTLTFFETAKQTYIAKREELRKNRRGLTEGGKGMATVAVTTDAIELMVQQNILIKDFIQAVQMLRDDLGEFKQSTKKPILLNEKEAAEYINMSVPFLSKSRSEGTLGDRTPAPGFLKLGKSVMYEKAELDRWISEDVPHRGYGQSSRSQRR